MKPTRIALIACVAGLLATPARPADWTLRLFGAAGDGSGSERLTTRGEVRVAVAGEAAGGFGVGFELGVAERTGLEVELIAGSVVASSWVVATGDGVTADTSVGFGQLGTGVNFDLAPERRLRIYLGPRLGYWRFERYEVEVGRGRGVREAVASESEFVLGALLGVELPLGSGEWRLAATLRWLEPIGSGDDGALLRPGPGMLTFGVARRF